MRSYTDHLATVQTGADSASLELTPDWLQGRTAFGGWQAALALRAMQQTLAADGGEAPPLRSLQVNFIAPIGPGPVCARAELLRRGKSAAQVEARIIAGGQVALSATGIFGQARASAIAERPNAAAAPAPESVADAPFINGMSPEFTRHFQQRWVRGQPPFSGAAHADCTIHVRFRHSPVVDDLHLVCLADAIPPSAIAMLKGPAMISSMNWTLELVAQPNESERTGWFRFDSSLTAAGDGYGWQHTTIWSDAGRLIALSRQCVALFG